MQTHLTRMNQREIKQTFKKMNSLKRVPSGSVALAASLKTVRSAHWEQMACWRLQANFLLLCWDHVALPSLCPLCQSGLWSLGPIGLPVQARRDHKSQSLQESSGPPPHPHPYPGPCCQRKSIALFCKDQSGERPGPKPAQTQQGSPALLALNPLSGVHWRRGRSSRCRDAGRSSHPEQEWASDSGDAPTGREQRLKGTWDKVEGRRVRAAKPRLLTWGPHRSSLGVSVSIRTVGI